MGKMLKRTYGVSPLLALEQHCVTLEKVELVHLLLADGHHRVVVIERLLNDQAVGCRLPVEDRCGQVLSVEKTLGEEVGCIG